MAFVEPRAGARPLRRLASSHAVTMGVFTLTLFVSALLLFSVQPMFAKMVLPQLGGSPSVWAVAMCFFQAMLLAGYCYAHAIGRLLWPGVAIAVHLVVCVLSLLVLPIGLSRLLGEAPFGNTYLWLIGLFTISVGLPFFAVSANAPLLQSWFARTGHPSRHDPYFLYGASNLGSLAALIAYPVAIEPWLGLQLQSSAWAWSFAGLALLLSACAGLMLLSNNSGRASEKVEPAAAVPIPRRTRLSWIVYAFVPSGLLVAFTTYITTDIASAPFLWVGPLILYLLTFVIVFRDPPLLRDRHVALLHLASVVLAVIAIALQSSLPYWAALLAGIAAFFSTALVAHRELYAARPPAVRLTEFYLWMSLGGVLGGVFAALIAPQIFSTVLEYPLLLLLGLVVRRDARETAMAREIAAAPWHMAAVFLIAMAVGEFASRFVLDASIAPGVRYAIGALAVASLASWRAGRMPLAVVSLLLIVACFTTRISADEYVERSFFGVHRIVKSDDGKFRLLVNGSTLHGARRLVTDAGEPVDRPVPATYYHPDGPMARAIASIRDFTASRGETFNAGIVGLGAGSLACYSRPDETWRFYEIDPVVIGVARDPNLFGFLSRCRPDADIVPGDARLTLHKEPAGRFDVLLIDAFSSDSIPVHLMTLEALELYLSKIKPGGALVLHVSNRHLQLETVLAAAAGRIGGLSGTIYRDYRSWPSVDAAGSIVVALTRDPGLAAALAANPFAGPLEARNAAPWTDDYSNILSAMIAKLRE